jgi:hypothetical protein
MLRTESSLHSHRQVEEGCSYSRRAWGKHFTTKCLHTHRTQKRAVAACASLLLCVTASIRSSGAASIAAPPIHTKPYRVLLVVEHWSDPHGLVVSSEADKFQPVAALLKAWSIPFDILRLDQQHLDATYLFRRSGGIRYGAVVWLADSSSYSDQDMASLEEATRAGTGLMVVNSRALDSTLGKLLGLKFKDFYASTDTFKVTKEHFITRDAAAGKNAQPPQSHDYSSRLWVQPTNAEVLIAQGQHSVLTVNQLALGVSAIWMGPPNLSMLCESGFWKNLLLRSLVWSLGYVVVPNVDYGHRVIFELDDWGTADKGFLSYWRYLEPNEETIRQYLIEPLQRHHATASAEVDTGYVDRQSKRVVSPWTQKFTDLYGLNQDYASTRRGLKNAAETGVLDIESHGWTHMEPNLEAPPGPWWTSDLSGEGSVVGWYAEFADQRRGEEVPAVTQIYHMERSLAELQEDFGAQALELKPGNNSWSTSQFNNTAGLAARVGFGLFHGDKATYYLDHELVLDLANVVPDFNTGYDLLNVLNPERWPDHPDGPVILGFHDRDIALDHNFMERLFTALPGNYQTLGTNQYIGIIHTQISSSPDSEGLHLTFAQDGHYCAYFANHPSSWRLWLSDPLREQLAASHIQVSIDDKPPRIGEAAFTGETLAIDLAPGLGTHSWRLEAAKNTQEP